MRDGQNREIRYIRVSVTDRCNLRCVYCMPPQGVEWLPHENILTYEEIGRICRILAEMGVDTVRLTGGEPLVRRGLEELVAMLKAIPGIRRVNLTTNGLLLARQLPALLSAGLDGVNISLDTLDQGQFSALTRRGDLFRVDQVLQGLEAALAAPGLEVKLNCVPMGYNDDQLVPLALLARERPLAVRFIEMMPIGLGAHMEGRSEAWVRARLGAPDGVGLFQDLPAIRPGGGAGPPAVRAGRGPSGGHGRRPGPKAHGPLLCPAGGGGRRGPHHESDRRIRTMGKVIAVCTSPAKGTEKHNVGTAELVEDWGIRGDAHAGKWHRQVSLLSYDKVEDFRARGAQVADGAFGENLLVQGIDFRALPVGTRRRKRLRAPSALESGHRASTPPHRRISLMMAASTTGTASRMVRYRAISPGWRGI